MIRKISIFAGSLAAVLFLAFVEVEFSQAPTPQSQTQTSGANANSSPEFAPDFELKTVDGRTVKLSDFRGKMVVLNFWATWCAPCRVEIPWLVEIYRRRKDQGIIFLGVSMDDGGPERVKEFIEEMKVDYTIGIGNRTVGDAYGGMRLLPQTFFIGRDGRIVNHTIGIKRKKEFEDEITHLMF